MVTPSPYPPVLLPETTAGSVSHSRVTMDHHCSPREAAKSEHGNLLHNQLGYSREVSNCTSPDFAHARAVQTRVSIHNPLRTTLA